MDDYIVLAIPKSQDKLHHVSNAIMTGIHYVFPPYNIYLNAFDLWGISAIGETFIFVGKSPLKIL